MKTAKELQKELDALQQEFDQYKRESIKWSVEDFTGEAKNIGYHITEEQAQDALERMIHKHDCELGITWLTIQYYIEEYGKPLPTEVNQIVKRIAPLPDEDADMVYAVLEIDAEKNWIKVEAEVDMNIAPTYTGNITDFVLE